MYSNTMIPYFFPSNNITHVTFIIKKAKRKKNKNIINYTTATAIESWHPAIDSLRIKRVET